MKLAWLVVLAACSGGRGERVADNVPKEWREVRDSAGHAVHVASDGKEAIEIAEEFHPDVIFLDINMPKVDGYEVCERLRANDWAEHVPIYALTSYDSAEHVQRTKAAGFDAHLTKPLDPDALPRLVSI